MNKTVESLLLNNDKEMSLLLLQRCDFLKNFVIHYGIKSENNLPDESVKLVKLENYAFC